MSWSANPAVENLPSANPWGLTPTEYHCARWYGEGFTAAEVAEKLHCAVSTINSHLERARNKVSAENRVHLAVLVALNEAGVAFAS